MRCFKLFLITLLILTAVAAQAQEPVSAADFSQRALNRFEKNDLDGAIADFTKAIELKGQQLEYCHYFRGIALYRRGRIDEAIVDLNKAITLKQHPRFYHDRANMLARKGDFAGALADLNRVIETEPKLAKAYGDRAIVHVMRGEDTAAEVDFEKCFELDKSLEFQYKATAQQLKRQAALQAEHQTPADIEIVKFSWKETAARVLINPAPAYPVTSTTLSQTGLVVTADPTAKDEPGPRVANPSSTARATTTTETRVRSDSETRVRGIDQTFTASIKNTGNKTITSVRWAYFFVPEPPAETFAYVFTSKINLPPGKTTNLRDQITSLVLPANVSNAPGAHNRAQFKERVVILRLDYADGTSWQSSVGTK